MELNFRSTSDFNGHNTSKLNKGHGEWITTNQRVLCLNKKTCTWWKSAKEMVGNWTLTGSNNPRAIWIPLLASWACSSVNLIVPKGPPVFVTQSNVPAECHLQFKPNQTQPHHIKIQKKRRMKWLVYLREADHDRCTVLLSYQASKLPPALLNSLLVVFAHCWVVLRHLC